MGTYKVISIVQSILLIIGAWSVIDAGYELYHLGTNQNLFIDKALFSSSSDLWNVFAFWGYLAIIMGILQIIKISSSKR